MSQDENFVPIVPTPMEQVQQVQVTRADTAAGTAVGTRSLKSLAIKRLRELKQVQAQVQPQVRTSGSCTYSAGTTGTPTAETYAAFCPRYWQGCRTCPDRVFGQLRFCGKYNSTIEAAGVIQ